jgi:hypothetical protein
MAQVEARYKEVTSKASKGNKETRATLEAEELQAYGDLVASSPLGSIPKSIRNFEPFKLIGSKGRGIEFEPKSQIPQVHQIQKDLKSGKQSPDTFIAEAVNINPSTEKTIIDAKRKFMKAHINELSQWAKFFGYEVMGLANLIDFEMEGNVVKNASWATKEKEYGLNKKGVTQIDPGGGTRHKTIFSRFKQIVRNYFEKIKLETQRPEIAQAEQDYLDALNGITRSPDGSITKTDVDKRRMALLEQVVDSVTPLKM